jgi:hypothetical protein
MFTRILVVLGGLIGGLSLWGGLEYYVMPLQDRPFSPLHDLYAPTGLIGHGFGIVGTLMILFGVVSYSLRKRVHFLARFGSLRNWLHFHIFLCLLGPFLVLLHTTFKFGGLVAISFWSMALVVASGVFGRWVYVWIPKTINGRFLAHEEVRERMWTLLDDVEYEGRLTVEQVEALHALAHGATGPQPAPARGGRGRAQAGPGESGEGASYRPPGGVDRRRRERASLGIGAALVASLRYRLGRRRSRARLHATLMEWEVPRSTAASVVRRIERGWAIEQQLRLLEPFRRALRYWHAFHLPLAAVMLLVLIVHVGVAVAFGYTWIF